MAKQPIKRAIIRAPFEGNEGSNYVGNIGKMNRAIANTESRGSLTALTRAPISARLRQ